MSAETIWTKAQEKTSQEWRGRKIFEENNVGIFFKFDKNYKPTVQNLKETQAKHT